MSTHFLRLIPIDPFYVPSPVARYQVCSSLASFLPHKEVQVKCSNEVAFIDAGNNLEFIQCPVCEAIVSLKWWSSMVKRSYVDSRFLDLSVMLPCCASSASLNDLHYMWPVGFARFVIEIHSPESDLAEQLQPVIQLLLGCSIRKIVAHY